MEWLVARVWVHMFGWRAGMVVVKVGSCRMLIGIGLCIEDLVQTASCEHASVADSS